MAYYKRADVECVAFRLLAVLDYDDGRLALGSVDLAPEFNKPEEPELHMLKRVNTAQQIAEELLRIFPELAVTLRR